MKKLESYYVLIENKKQAEQYKYILKAAGIDTSNYVIDDYDRNCREIGWCKRGGFWLSGGYSGDSNYQNISIGQLIDLLNEPKKIAVKVENEKEAKAICKFKGWAMMPTVAWIGKNACVIYVDLENFDYNSLSDHIAHELYKYCQIIPFTEFAKEHNIKLPLITSEDGVDLFEGDPYVMVKKIPATNNEWKITREDVKLKETHFPITDPDHCLAFSTKQAALDWIEAQKPKETVLEFGAYKFTVKQYSVNVSHGDSDTFIDIISIYKAFLELN